MPWKDTTKMEQKFDVSLNCKPKNQTLKNQILNQNNMVKFVV